MTPLRICIVGAGDWSSRMHLPVLKRLAAAGLIACPAVCDLDRPAAQRYADLLGEARVFADAAEMLDACRPDGVAVLVNPAATASVVMRAAERRIPFLAEKPPAESADSHRRLIAAAGELPHLVAYNRRHAPYVLRAKQWMGQSIGELSTATADARGTGILPVRKRANHGRDAHATEARRSSDPLAASPVQSVTALFSRHRRHDRDFSTTAAHAIDTARFLAGDPFAELIIESAPAATANSPGGSPPAATPAWVRNYFLAGWTRRGVRIDIAITPDTASAAEHYFVRGARRSAAVAFPQSKMIDLPGFVELHESNRVSARLAAADFGLADDDLPALGGILGEYESFVRAIRGEVPAASTLADTLQTQQVREELARLAALPGRQSAKISFPTADIDPHER